MGETRQTLTQEFLRDQIEQQKKTCKQVASETGWDPSTVAKWARRYGIATFRPLFQKGEKHPFWKGKHTTRKGYIKVHQPTHPHASNGYVYEHRLVMESMIGRYLEWDEVVHHKNGQRNDNRPENLELYSNNAEHVEAEHSWSREKQSLLQGLRTKKKGKIPKEELQRLYVSKSAAQIAAEYGANEATIRRWLKDYGIQTVQHRQRFPSNEQLASDLADMAPKDVAAKYGGTVMQLYKALQHRKTTVRKLRQTVGIRSAEWPSTEQLAADLQAMSTHDVVKKYHGTLNQLYQVLHNRGTGVRKLRQLELDS